MSSISATIAARRRRAANIVPGRESLAACSCLLSGDGGRAFKKAGDIGTSEAKSMAGGKEIEL